MASLTVNTRGLNRIAAALGDPAVQTRVMEIPHRKAIAALVGQAIADNFAQEGPGWEPLKAATIRRSVAKKMRKSLAEMSDKELLAHERNERKKGDAGTPYRMILQKTGLLKMTATTPNFHGSRKSGKKTISGGNIWKVEGTNLIWGTDLAYASIHQRGDPSKNIPARPYLVIHPQWMGQIKNYVVEAAFQIIRSSIIRRAKG